ncbi:MAG TPA: CpaF family protein [Ramlibacter sp.]|uniref:CpaF family protein n=1 Tax=Ramlibacter sp. TaxID=1917967 RepID=UPI002D7E6098|nr:CpaF family protein [Ramlibacter sp.]HET8746401.1 CpaF family protein [Ramlibacter sp.]
MSLRETLEQQRPSPVLAGLASIAPQRQFALVKSQLHKDILAQVDLRSMEAMPQERLRAELGAIAERLLDQQKEVLSDLERRAIVEAIQNEMLGLGPLEPLLADTTVSDILVNGPGSVYVERRGKLEQTAVRFDSSAHLMRVIDKIVSRVGRRIDESSPMVDARLPDGSRVNAVIPPLALDGPMLSIRRFAVIPYGMDDLLSFGTLTREMAELVTGLVRGRVNLLISGGTGSGKTTLLNVMSAAIPADERIITIEDAAELQLQQPHVVRLETRPPNIEGKGEINQRALVRNSLRMRPDRIIVGEVRGAEVLDMLQAMNTGHEGSMTTIHANSPRDALTRLEHMLGMAGLQASARTMRHQISAALSVVIQISRMADGRRKLVSLQELTGMEGDVVTMQEIFLFDQTGVASDGSVLGRFRATGIRPKFAQRLRTRGVELAEDLFDPERRME